MGITVALDFVIIRAVKDHQLGSIGRENGVRDVDTVPPRKNPDSTTSFRYFYALLRDWRLCWTASLLSSEEIGIQHFILSIREKHDGQECEITTLSCQNIPYNQTIQNAERMDGNQYHRAISEIASQGTAFDIKA